jgi:hypothetical protein
LLLAEDESTSVVNGALVGVLLSQSASPSVVIVCFSPDRHNLGFLTEGKLAAIFIKPSLGVPNWPVIYFINSVASPTSSKNIRRNQGNSNAKFAVTPHRCSKVMVKKTRRGNDWKLGGAHKAIHE